jgi:hypothetical protein
MRGVKAKVHSKAVGVSLDWRNRTVSGGGGIS